MTNCILCCKFNDGNFLKQVTRLDFNVINNRLDAIGRINGKLDKYNLYFAKHDIHFYYSEIYNIILPVYWNSHFVDAFFYNNE
jgi:hypothetical protein